MAQPKWRIDAVMAAMAKKDANDPHIQDWLRRKAEEEMAEAEQKALEQLTQRERQLTEVPEPISLGQEPDPPVVHDDFPQDDLVDKLNEQAWAGYDYRHIPEAKNNELPEEPDTSESDATMRGGGALRREPIDAENETST